MSTLSSQSPLTEPFVGIRPYTRAHADVFHERRDNARALLETLLTRRLIMLYGDSGNGKSSLINAGLVPMLERLRSKQSLQPEVLRIEKDFQGLTVDRRPLAIEGGDPAPSAFHSLFSQAPGEDNTASFTLPVAEVTRQLRDYLAKNSGKNVLLIFDQFEELYTYGGVRGAFTSVAARGQQETTTVQAGQRLRDQAQLAVEIGNLIRATQGNITQPNEPQVQTGGSDAKERDSMVSPENQLPAKFLFTFREEYMVKLQALLPDLLTAAPFRLSIIPEDRLPRIIEGPFLPASSDGRRPAAPFSQDERAPFFLQYAASLCAGFKVRLGGIGQNVLTELQVVCTELWCHAESREKVQVAAPKGPEAVAISIDEIISFQFQRFLQGLPNRSLALDLMCEMVTASGTRNVVGEPSLRDLFEASPNPEREEGPFQNRHPWSQIQEALKTLGGNRFINRSERNGTYFYDIASESLIPWLSRERRSRLEQFERKRTREAFAQKRLKAWLGWGGLLLTLMTALACWAYSESVKAKLSAQEAFSASVIAEKEKIIATLARDEAERQKQNALNEIELSKRQLLAQEEELSKVRIAHQQDLQKIQSAITGGDGALKTANVVIKDSDTPLISRLEGATGDITCAAYSPDGRFVAVGSEDKKLRIWSRLGGNLLGVAPASTSTGGVRTLAFSPDSSLLLAGSSGNSVRLFDPRLANLGGGKEITVHKDSITHLEFSPDGRYTVSSSADGTVALLDWSKYPKDIPTLSIAPATWRHGKTVTYATFSADGSRIVSSGDDGKIKVFQVGGSFDLIPITVGGSSINPLDVDQGKGPPYTPIRHMRFNPADRSLVVGGAGNKKVVWLSLKGDRIALYRDDEKAGPYFHIGAVLDTAFRANGAHLATIATDGLCLIWDVSTAKTVASVPTEIQGRIFDVEWQKDDLLALVGEDGWMELWDMKIPGSPQRVFATQAHNGVARGVRFDPLSRQVLTWSGYQDGHTNASLPYLPDAKGKAAELKFPGKDRPSDNTAAIWDIEAARSHGWTKHPGP